MLSECSVNAFLVSWPLIGEVRRDKLEGKLAAVVRTLGAGSLKAHPVRKACAVQVPDFPANGVVTKETRLLQVEAQPSLTGTAGDQFLKAEKNSSPPHTNLDYACEEQALRPQDQKDYRYYLQGPHHIHNSQVDV